MQQALFGMRIIGPAIAGILYVRFGARPCYIGDAFSFLCSGLIIASLTLAGPLITATTSPDAAAAPEASKGLSTIVADMRQGISFIVHHAALLFVILALTAGIFVVSCFGPLIAVYVRDSIHGGTSLYSWSSGMLGVGMFAGVNALNTVGKKISNTILVYGGLGGIGLGLIILVLLPHAWSTILGNFVIGIAIAGIVVPANTLIQQETPVALMGRVGSTTMSLVSFGQVTGLVLSGLLTDHIGVRAVFACCAAMLAVLIVAGKLFMEPNAEPAAA